MSLKSDFLAMNVSWYPNELKLFTNQASVVLSTILTIILIITFLIGVKVQKAIFKMLKRLPERAINQIIYPYMVKTLSYIYNCLNFLTNCFGFQVLLSSFMGPYFLFYILILWIYPVKTYVGEFACYLMIYSRSVYVFTSNFYKTFYQILSSCYSGKVYKALCINLR